MLDTKPMDAERAPPRGAAAIPLATGDNGFIREAERLAFPGFPDIATLRCRYCAPAYHDTLFDELGILCPEQVRPAVRKRKAEYLAGRYLCRILLGERGLPTLVANGSHRQPLWPAGWIGSVTHTYDTAVCCLASQAAVNILGIDVERWLDADAAASIAPGIVNRDEEARFVGPWPYREALTLAFSAKESLFKAVFPQVGAYFDFDCAEWIGADHAAGTFSLRIAKTLTAAIPAGRLYRGYFEDWGDCLVTLIAEAAAAPR
jgi:enterobactin synthetase component D